MATDWNEFTGSVIDGDTLSGSFYNQGYNAIPPVASIMPWAKSLPDTEIVLPTGWVEANGQTITNPDSIFVGSAIPDLNGDNRFLQGNQLPGATGGEESTDFTHTHTYSTTRFNDVNENNACTSVGPIENMTNPVENRPPFYDVVWLMRIV